MNKIICLIGACSSGKDSILQEIIKNPNYKPSISYTTRPMRDGEKDGREYNFTNVKHFKDMLKNKDLIEYRSYDTLVNNNPQTWYYGLSKHNNGIDLSTHSSVVIMDVDGCKSLIDYYGRENVYVVYIKTWAITRMARCIKRGDYDETEFNRRLKDDERVFSKDNLESLNIDLALNNDKDGATAELANIIIEKVG